MTELKGWHVLAIAVSFFGVIIAVNAVLAVQAVSTFPGLEVENSYVASQEFDANRKAQEALGWTLATAYDPARKELALTFTDAGGAPADLADLAVLVGRTTKAKEDSHPEFRREAGVYRAAIDLQPGKWMMHVTAHARDGTLFRQRIDLYVKERS